MSDLADILDNLNVDDDLVSDGRERHGSINLIESVLRERVESSDFEQVSLALLNLRRVKRVYNALHHSGASSELGPLLDDLGLAEIASDWSRLWNGIRAVSTIALLTIRDCVRKIEQTVS